MTMPLSKVAEHHAKYVQSLVDLFDRHKAKYNQPNEELEVW